MSNTPHELSEEFPGKAERIHALREEDPHFRRIADRYHEVNRAIHRAETNVEPTGQFQEEDMRKERLRLKDEIARILAS